MSDIFISYASQDRVIAERLSTVLAAEGWTVWWDRTIPPGKSFARMIEDALNDCKCVVVLWSRMSRDSDWVQNEARHGHRHGALIPALIEDVAPPFEFQHIQAAALMDWGGETAHPGYRQLVSAISDIVGAPPVPGAGVESNAPVEVAPPPAVGPSADRRIHMAMKPKWLVAAALLLLAVFGISTVVYQRNTAMDQAHGQAELAIEAAGAPQGGNTRMQAEQALQVSDWKLVARADVNVRRGPGSHHDTLAVLPQGTLIAVTGLVDDWFEVALADGRQGYVSVEFMEGGIGVSNGSGYTPGDTFRDCAVCPEMVVVPAGSFLMGSPPESPLRYNEEGPQHRVIISNPFAVGVYEVTFADWDACADDGGCNGYRPQDEGWGRDRRPVVNVNWSDAQAYVQWLSEKTGQSYRLLTEAEWEYVARAGTETRYSLGDTIAETDANFNMNVGQTSEVGTYPANRWGLHDVHGNVWEWVADCYERTAYATHENYPAMVGGLHDSCRRVLRGGSWSRIPRYLRSATRLRFYPDIRSGHVGFRVARML